MRPVRYTSPNLCTKRLTENSGYINESYVVSCHKTDPILVREQDFSRSIWLPKGNEIERPIEELYNTDDFASVNEDFDLLRNMDEDDLKKNSELGVSKYSKSNIRNIPSNNQLKDVASEIGIDMMEIRHRDIKKQFEKEGGTQNLKKSVTAKVLGAVGLKQAPGFLAKFLGKKGQDELNKQ